MEGGMNMTVVVWLIIMIVLLAFEALTVGLTTIWFAAGALVAAVACAMNLSLPLQLAVFFVVSMVMLIFTRPWAMRYFNPHKVRTNYEEAIGKVAKVTATIDNRNNTGTAVLGGQEWTARAALDDTIIAKDALVKVVDIQGVKLIVELVEK